MVMEVAGIIHNASLRAPQSGNTGLVMPPGNGGGTETECARDLDPQLRNVKGVPE
jgi:hypothetical protein